MSGGVLIEWRPAEGGHETNKVGNSHHGDGVCDSVSAVDHDPGQRSLSDLTRRPGRRQRQDRLKNGGLIHPLVACRILDMSYILR